MKKNFFSIYTLLLVSFLFANKLNATIYHLKAGGDMTVLADWGVVSDGSGTHPASFAGNNTWNLATNNAALSLSSVWGLSGVTPNIIFGTGSSAFTFILASGGQIGTTPNNVNVAFNNNSTFRLQTPYVFNPGRTTINTGSTFIYESGSETSPIGGDTYYNLELQAGLTIDLNGNSIIINNNLNLNSTSNLQLNAGTVDIKNTVSGAGVISDNASGSTLLFEGTGAIGTVNFDAVDNNLTVLILSLGSAASSVKLGSDVIIDGGVLQLNSGALDLNGTTLTIANTSAIDFSGGGTIIGSTASTFSCVATTSAGGITGSLNMDASNNNLKALVLNSSGETLTLGSQLNIADFVQVDAGTLATAGNMVLKATNLLTARVGSIGATGSITGNVTTETYVRGPSTGWSLWGANGVSGLQVNNWEAQIPMACQGCPNGVTSAGGYFESVQSWNEFETTSGQEYDTTITNTTPLTPGKGFWVYVGSGFSTTTDYVIANTGPLVQGPVSIPVTDDGNALVLISNPYASPISWDAVFAANSGSVGFITSSIYGFNAEGGGVGSTYSSGGPGGAPTGIDNVIPAGQGFFIDMFAAFSFCPTLAPCQLIIDESMKVSNNTSSNPVIRTSSSASSNSGRPWFRIKLDGFGGDFDQTVFSVMPDATDTYDRKYDGRKIFQTPGYVGYPGSYNKYTSISSKMDTLDYSINTVGPLTHSVTIPVLVRVAASGTYTISLRDFNNYSSCMILRDKLTNTLTDLRVNPYVFTISDTTSAPRFEMVMCENGNTTVSLTELKEAFGSVTINQDELGAFVTTNFEKNTKATISAYNIMGQQLLEDIEIEGKATTTRLNLNVHNQVVIIRVSSDKETTTKKIIAH